ncbi:hypothetical protein [Streptomyces halobius]|uniref:Uncharacterized protein n=1 Tax=Streptomyces halobius TaxID=2879846 RepID=A0ABY4MHC1_9ACTN|nr:hypothetical protein [Streptomyces halobius]UQA97107.1 hypothetical protein K9S39_39260 [Streptomyces halobius]
MVLTVYADRTGRLWRIAEMCARCAAATPNCRVLDTAPPPTRTAPAGTDQAAGTPDAEPAGGTVGDHVAAVFSDHGPSPAAGASSSPTAAPGSVPPLANCPEASRRAPWWEPRSPLRVMVFGYCLDLRSEATHFMRQPRHRGCLMK